MSQTATIISCGISKYSEPNDWSVIVSYLSDAGAVLQAEVFIGPGPAPFGALNYPMWASATSTISATLSGYSSNVLIPVPALIRWTAFGVKIQGLPTQ